MAQDPVHAHYRVGLRDVALTMLPEEACGQEGYRRQKEELSRHPGGEAREWPRIRSEL